MFRFFSVYPLTRPNFDNIFLIDSGSAALHSPKNSFRISNVFPGLKRWCFLNAFILKKAFSVLRHSLPPLLPVAFPYIHKTTSHGSAANDGAENPAARHSNPAAIAVFFIAISFRFNCGWRLVSLPFCFGYLTFSL
uniref:Uncharacterized protein n=1 Tax=Photorhabdus asymbiotica TaxID=291112 RepID=D8MBZ8_9GAMM|nr:hypothetical protein pPAA3_0009 [Photorhabdus asymbiotica]